MFVFLSILYFKLTKKYYFILTGLLVLIISAVSITKETNMYGSTVSMLGYVLIQL